MATTAAPTDRIETTTCGRCGGSGRYSYCTMYGSTCFGCGGSGKKFTKRGAVAHRFLEDLRSVRVEDLKVGDLVRERVGLSSTVTFYTVAMIDSGPASDFGYSAENTSICYQYTLTHAKHQSTVVTAFEGSKVRKGWTAEEKQAQLRKAIEFQSTLTARGEPRRRAA
jgi:hypothetical protein